MKKTPSPCIDVCKFRLAGHCIGCSMTKEQKKLFKKGDVPPHEQIGFIVTQQRVLGRFKGWEKAYRKKCDKKGVPCPLDSLDSQRKKEGRKRKSATL